MTGEDYAAIPVTAAELAAFRRCHNDAMEKAERRFSRLDALAKWHRAGKLAPNTRGGYIEDGYIAMVIRGERYITAAFPASIYDSDLEFAKLALFLECAQP